MRKILGVVLALVVAVGARADDEPAAVVDKALKALGGKEKLARYKAHQWKAKGVLMMGDMKLPYAVAYSFQQPDQFRFDMTAEIMGNKTEITAATDGKQAWERGFGMVREMAKEKAAEFQHTAYVINLSQLTPLTDKAYTLTAAGEAKVNDRPVIGVKVAAKGHRDVTLYFDKESGLLVKSQTRIMDEFTMKEATQETLMLEYKEKDGVKYFHKMLIKRDGKPFIEEEFSDQKSLEKLDPKSFAKP